MNNSFVRHPDSVELLMLEHGELPERAGVSVRRHLAGCGKCQSALEELRDVTEEFRRYRETEILPHLPARRLPWQDLRPAMARFDLAHPPRKTWPNVIQSWSFPASRWGHWLGA